jgi:S-phase kinase-associated protein 1
MNMNTDNDNDETTMIKLRSMADEDGNTQVFDISMAAAKISDLIKDAAGVDDREDDDDDDDETPLEIEVSRVKGPCLAKVVDFMKHHHEEKMKEIPTPLGGSSFNEVMDQEWYQNFVSDENLGNNNDMLFDLLTAANFMGIKELLDLSCLKVTFQLTGKSADEIREILRLPELTPEEEQQARMEHKWIFEDS